MDDATDMPAASTAGPTLVRARPGDLTMRWRMLLGAAWIAAFFAYASVWQASVQIGIGTWWTGPRAQPPIFIIRVLPFLLCLAIALCVIYNTPRLLQTSAAGVVLAAIGALPDFSRSPGLGTAELVIAGLLGVVTAAAFTGRYRVPDEVQIPGSAPSSRSASLPPPPSVG